MDGYVEIQNNYYNCIIKGNYCIVFIYVNDNDVDYIGKFEIKGDKIYEYFPMENSLKEVGIIHRIQ